MLMAALYFFVPLGISLYFGVVPSGVLPYVFFTATIGALIAAYRWRELRRV
jgi:hypothetical protein